MQQHLLFNFVPEVENDMHTSLRKISIFERSKQKENFSKLEEQKMRLYLVHQRSMQNKIFLQCYKQ